MGKANANIAVIAFSAVLLLESLLPRRALAQAPLERHTAYTPLTIEDPVPANDFVIAQPRWESSRDMESFGYSSSIFKQLSSRVMLDVSTDWVQTWPRHQRSRSGFTDVELLPMYQFVRSTRHALILAAAANFQIATGGPAGAGADDTTRLGPYLLFAKGMGTLPDGGWARYLRPILLQGGVGYGFDTSHQGKQHPIAGIAVSYSIPFIEHHVEWIPVGPLLSQLALFSEFSYDQTVAGSSGRTPPDFRIVPGLAILTKKYQLAFGVQLPLNHYATREDRIAVIGMFDIFYDELVPALGKQLF
jgi:hypothetical protein